MNDVYNLVKKFKAKYPLTVAWRTKQHCKIVEKHLNPGEKVEYAFTCQKGPSSLDIITSYVVVLTNQRLILATKRVVFGYFFYSITPDLYNDLEVRTGLIWGNVIIDTVKEEIVLSNIDKRALPEVETAITTFMMVNKNKYKERADEIIDTAKKLTKNKSSKKTNKSKKM